MSAFEDVKTFNRLFESAPSKPQLMDDTAWTLRIRLILEELSEVATAHASHDMDGFADGLVDLTYVVLGTAVQAGIPFDLLWDEVHAANMAKKGGGVGIDGKVLKPDGWRKPRSLSQLLEVD